MKIELRSFLLKGIINGRKVEASTSSQLANIQYTYCLGGTLHLPSFMMTAVPLITIDR